MIPQQLPVALRNGTGAAITGRVDAGVFRLAGYHETGTYDLWQETGHWREDKTPHPFDIVHGAGITFPASKDVATA